MGNKRKVESEINYKDLLKNPIRLFGLVYIYFIVVILAVGIYFVKSIDQISFNSFPGTSLDTLNIVRDIDSKVGGIKPAMDLGLITDPTPEFIARGKAQYESACASCHGNDGIGDGVAAVALDPKPRNFLSTEGWKNGRTFYDLYRTLNDGLTGTTMAAYEFIPPEDRVAIIHYLRTFGDFPDVTVAEVNEKLDATYNLSAGVVEPYNIPVQKSISILSDENKKDIELAVMISQKINNDEIENANLLKKNVLDIEKVVYTFITNLKQNGYNDFVIKVKSDPVALGYKASVLNLNDEELRKIYSYLNLFSNQEIS